MGTRAIGRFLTLGVAAVVATQAAAAQLYFYRQTNGPGGAAALVPAAGGNAQPAPAPSTLSASPPGSLSQTAASGTACAAVPVSNASTVPTTGLSASLAKGTDFALCQPTATACTGTLAGGASCNFGVRLVATAPGAKTDTLLVSAAGATAQVDVTGSYANPTGLSFTSSSYTYHQGVAGSIQPVVTGGIGTRSWAFDGTPPAGLSINAATGTVSVAAASSPVARTTVGVRLSDANGSVTANFDFAVLPPMTLAYADTALPFGQALSLQPTASNLGAGVRFSVQGTTSLSLYGGLSLDPDTGTVTNAGNNFATTPRTVTLVATAQDGSKATAVLRYSVQPPLQSVSLSPGAATYGSPASSEVAMGIGDDGKGYSIPANGTVTFIYNANYNGYYVTYATGPAAGGRLKIEYLSAGGVWTPTMVTGSQDFAPNTGGGSGLSNPAATTAHRGLRVTNVGGATAQLDYVSAWN